MARQEVKDNEERVARRGNAGKARKERMARLGRKRQRGKAELSYKEVGWLG